MKMMAQRFLLLSLTTLAVTTLQANNAAAAVDDAPEDDDCGFCKLIDDETLKETWNLKPTPLPGNFFTMDKYNDGMITVPELYPWADTEWFQQWYPNSESFPAMVRVRVLRQANVKEELHFLPSNHIWAYNGGCTSTMYVVHRDTLEVETVKLGPNVAKGEQSSIFIKAGDYYAHEMGPNGSAFLTSTISPGFNTGADIVTPTLPQIVRDLGIDPETNVELYEFLQLNSRPPPAAEEEEETEEEETTEASSGSNAAAAADEESETTITVIDREMDHGGDESIQETLMRMQEKLDMLLAGSCPDSKLDEDDEDMQDSDPDMEDEDEAVEAAEDDEDDEDGDKKRTLLRRD